MNAAEIITAVRKAGSSVRVKGDSLVISNASRVAPEIKAAVRQNKPQIIAALSGSCSISIIELPAAERYRSTFALLQTKPPALVPVERWRQCVEDGSRFLAKWGDQAQALGWTSADLFGLAPIPDKPHPSFNRLSRYDLTGLVWLLEGRAVVALTEATATVKSKTGNITTYRRFNKPALGPLGDSLKDFV